MLSKTYHLKFPSLDAAQIAAPFVIESLGNAIPTCNLSGLNVLISKEGDVSINVFFPSVAELKNFEKKHGGFLETMKRRFFSNQWVSTGSVSTTTTATRTRPPDGIWPAFCRANSETFLEENPLGKIGHGIRISRRRTDSQAWE